VARLAPLWSRGGAEMVGGVGDQEEGGARRRLLGGGRGSSSSDEQAAQPGQQMRA
jgi:hypothetical protein